MSNFVGVGANSYDPYEMQTPFSCGARQKGAEKKEKSAMDLLADWKETLYQKIVNGETEETYQIGATSYTQTEWEKLLAHFDALSESMREASRAEFEKREEKIKETQAREKAEQTKEQMRIDEEKAQWAKYMNPPGAHFYTAQEMYEQQARRMAENHAVAE